MTSGDALTPEQAGPATPPANELRARVGSAVILGLVAVAAAWLGGFTFLLFSAAAAFVVWWEWTGIIGSSPRFLLVAIGWLALAAMAVALAMDVPAIAFVCAVIGAAVAMATAMPGRGWAGGGVLYAAALLVPVVMLRNDGAFGLVAVLFLFAVVWAEDTGAYFTGRLIGGAKLAPAISPSKTWSGAIGGTISGILAGSLVILASGLPWRPAHIAVAFALAVAAQGGDLAESAVKRRFGVKDASTLIPGHGGMMDRVDGLLFAATAALAIGLIRSGTAPANGLLSW